MPRRTIKGVHEPRISRPAGVVPAGADVVETGRLGELNSRWMVERSTFSAAMPVGATTTTLRSVSE